MFTTDEEGMLTTIKNAGGTFYQERLQLPHKISDKVPFGFRLIVGYIQPLFEMLRETLLKLLHRSGTPWLLPCPPSGIQQLFAKFTIPLLSSNEKGSEPVRVANIRTCSLLQ